MSYHGECKEISALCIEGPGGSKGLAGGQELREMAILVFQFNHTCCFICIFYCIYIHFLHSYILIIYIYIYIQVAFTENLICQILRNKGLHQILSNRRWLGLSNRNNDDPTVPKALSCPLWSYLSNRQKSQTTDKSILRVLRKNGHSCLKCCSRCYSRPPKVQVQSSAQTYS